MLTSMLHKDIYWMNDGEEDARRTNIIISISVI